MLTFDSVKLRLEREQPLTFLEFNYMLMQAVRLPGAVAARSAAGCRWAAPTSGAISSTASSWPAAIDGTELFGADHAAAHHRRRREDGQDGAGRGVAERGPAQPLRLLAVLAEHRGRATWARFLRLFTDLPLDEIARLESLPGAEINEAKKVLATEATALLHGREAAEAAARTAAETFAGGGAGEDLPTLALGDGMTIAHALTALGFTPSNKEAKRKIAEGAVRLDDVTLSDAGLILTAGDKPLKLSLGKKRHALLVK